MRNLLRPLLLITTILTLNAFAANTPVSLPQASAVPTIVLPSELIVNQTATIAVLAPDGHVSPGIKLILSHGEMVTTDESGRAHFLAPPDAGILIARIPGTQARAAADVSPGEHAANLQIASVPPIVGLKDRFAIHGVGMQGDADRNHVEIDGQPAFVLAASPVELVILASPRTVPGSARLSAKVGSSEVSARITLIDVVTDAVSGSVKPGKKVRIILHVRGTSLPTGLRIRNLAPEVVQFKHGNAMYVSTKGGADNFATIEVKGIRAGDFAYSVELVRLLGTANPAVARDFLEAAAKLAAGDEKRQIENVLKRLRSKNPDIRSARKEFAKLSAENSWSDLQALLGAAAAALNGQ